MKEMSLLLGLTLLLTFLALGYTEGYTESCGYLIKNQYNTTGALINGNITLDIQRKGLNTTYNVTCLSSSELNIINCVSCTDNMISGTFYDVTLENIANSNESLFANITYTFTSDTKSQDWSLSNMTISIDEDEDENNQTVALEGWVDGYKYIMNNVSLDYQRSYQCKANMSFLMNCSVTTTNGNMSNMSSCNGSLYISFVNFQVQAFSFYNDPNATTFGNIYMCDADTTGSKIVPIAVGIALAVLVCIVLIAYLIGRFKSRRQSSYETLK